MPFLKQPIGLRPKWIADRMRAQEILEACLRYITEGKRIPQEWLDELAELNGKLKILNG